MSLLGSNTDNTGLLELWTGTAGNPETSGVDKVDTVALAVDEIGLGTVTKMGMVGNVKDTVSALLIDPVGIVRDIVSASVV